MKKVFVIMLAGLLIGSYGTVMAQSQPQQDQKPAVEIGTKHGKVKADESGPQEIEIRKKEKKSKKK